MHHDILALFAEYLEKQDLLSKLTESETLHSFGYSEIHTIAAIGSLEEPNVTSIAGYLHMTKGAVSKIIRRLTAAKAVESYQRTDNRQKIFYRLTETGKFLYAEHEKRHQLWLERDQQFLARYTVEELDFLQTFLTDFNHYLQEKITELGGNEP